MVILRALCRGWQAHQVRNDHEQRRNGLDHDQKEWRSTPFDASGSGRVCQSVGGRQIERAVVAEVFAALEPAALATTVKALAEAEHGLRTSRAEWWTPTLGAIYPPLRTVDVAPTLL